MTEAVDVFVNPFAPGLRSNADVVMIVEEHELHLHSQILSDGSPVFKTMLDGNFVEGIRKRVELKNKKARYVIEFLEFFYPSLGATVNAQTNWDKVLMLCDEYDVTWIKDRIKKFLLNEKMNDKQAVYFLYLSEVHDLLDLKKKLLADECYSCWKCMVKCPQFEMLTLETKACIFQQRLKLKFKEKKTHCYSHCEEDELINFVMVLARKD